MQINKSGLSITWPKFEPEAAGLRLKHHKKGMLTINNDFVRGQSVLIITFEPSPWMDGRQVVVGEMIEGPLGGEATLDKMRKSVNNYSGISTSNFRIESTGHLFAKPRLIQMFDMVHERYVPWLGLKHVFVLIVLGYLSTGPSLKFEY